MFVIFVGVVVVELMVLLFWLWEDNFVGYNVMYCLIVILLLFVGFFLCIFVVFCRGVLFELGFIGVVVGLVVSGIGVMFYVVNCIDDSLLFVVVWYFFVVLIVVGVVYFIGVRVFCW